ncbi:MAG: glycosyltransferase, partial [Gemmatimonadetes bacterium]|nr:glycosyltransferase [Gemmatimonadota bacterium]
AYDTAVATRHLRRSRARVVHARSYVAATMGSLGTRGGDGRLLFDMRGFWIDERIEGQGWNPEGLKARQGRRVERALLARADHVVHLTDAGRTALAEASGGSPERHSTIPTCVDMERFSVPPDRGAARAAVGLPPRRPVLIHSGTLGARYQVGRTLDIGRRFKERSGGTFVVVTQDVEAVSQRAADMGVQAVIRSATPQEMPAWIGAADFGLALVAPGPAGVASAPTKVGEYLASGLGVVATAVGDLAVQLGRARHSRVLSSDVGGEEVVDWLLAQPSPAAREEESRALAERYYDLSDALDRYEDIYRRLGARPCA